MICYDLFCGLGGWCDGFRAEGYEVIGYDIERHDYGTGGYPALLVLQDVLTLHGSEFKNATCIVASPPCQGYSYRAMPWKRAKALPPPDNTFFEACFRIQREACEAAGRHIPMVVENVRGAEKWVGSAKWHFGSYYLWGDVPALMPPAKAFKSKGMNWSDRSIRGQDFTRLAGEFCGLKGVPHKPTGHWTNPDENGTKQGGDWFGKNCESSMSRLYGSKSLKRKAASAQIAKIPYPLASHIARCFKIC